jgi:flagellar assembly factor FliW
MLKMLDGKIINVDGSLLGFNHLNQFHFSVIEEDSPYGYLESTEDPNIGFIVASPFHFYTDYIFEMEDNEKSKLEINSQEDVLVLGIVNVKEPFADSTINLLAPILINIHNRAARQVVLPPKYNYTTKSPLFNIEAMKGGDV